MDTPAPIDPPVECLTLEDLKGTPRVAQVLEKVFFQALDGDMVAAKLYLSRVMPEIKSVELTGKDGSPLTIAITAIDARL